MGRITDSKKQHFHRVIDTLKEINQLLVHEKDLTRLIKKTCSILVNTRGYYFASLVLFDDEDNVSHIESAGKAGEFENLQTDNFNKQLSSLQKEVLLSNEVGIYSQLPEDCMLNIEQEDWKLFIAPLSIDSEIPGLLCAIVSDADAKHAKEEKTFRDIAESIAFSIGNIKNSLYMAEMILNAPDGFVLFDRELNISSVNPAFCKMLNVEGEALSGKNIGELIDGYFQGKQFDNLRKLVERLKQGVDVEKFEFSYSGKVYRIGVKRSISKLRLAIICDITKDVEEQTVYQQSEAKYRKLLNALSDAVIIIQDEVIKYANTTLFRISGYSEDELIGCHFSRFVMPDRKEEVLSMYSKRMAGEKVSSSYHSEVVDKRNKKISVEVTVVSTNFEGKPALQIALRDVSPMREAMQQLKESEERFRILSESAFDGIVIHDNGVIIDVNQTLLKILGYKKSEMVGKSIYDFMKAEAITKVNQHIGKAETKPYVVTLKNKLGKPIYAELEAKNIILNGKEVRIVDVRDITEKFKLEKEIKETQEKHNNLLNHLPGMAYTCQNNQKWDMEFMSQGCYELTGFEPESFLQEGGKSYNDIIHHNDRQLVWNTIQTAINNNQLFEMEYRIKTKSGHEKWVWERGSQIQDNGQILLQGLITDITVRKKAIQAVQKSEIKYRALFNAINDAILIHSFKKEGVNAFSEVNNQACKLFGYTRDEMLRLSARDLTVQSEENIRISKENRQRLIEKGAFICELEQQNKNGEIIPVEISSRLFEVEGQKMIMSLIRDISKRKETEEKLIENEQRYRVVFENTGAATCILENDGTISLANAEFANLSGYTLEEVQGHKTWMDFAHSKDLDIMKTRHQLRRKNNEKAAKSYQFRFIDKKNNLKHINLIIDIIPGTNKSVASLTDITPIKEFEDRLIEKNEQLKLEKEKVLEAGQRYHSLFSNSASAMLLINPEDGQIIDANRVACDFYKYNYGELTSLKINQINILPDEEINKAMKEVSEKHRTQFNFKHRLADGTIKDVEVYSGALSFSGQNLLYSIVHDITLRKEAELKLSASEQLMNTILQSIPSGFIMLDEEYRIFRVNDETCTITGYKNEELEGQLCSIICPNATKLMQCNICDEGAVAVAGHDTFILHKNGHHIPILKNAQPITINGKNYLLESFQDTTEWKQVEKQLIEAKELAEQNETRFKTLHDASFGGIAIHDKGLILDCNHGLTRLSGYSHEELVGMEGLLLIAEETRQMVMDKIIAEYEKPYEATGIRKDGTKYFLHLEGRMIPYKNGKVRVTEFRDISDIKETEIELTKAKERAEKSDKLKSSFLANMSHEIRTPMNGILGFTELLKGPGLSGEQQEEFIEIIQRSGERMLSTINDIINISKIESGLEEISPVQLELNGFLNELRLFFLPETNMKGLELRYINAGMPSQYLFVDAEKLNSILTNLIKNAVKFTHKGSISFGYSLKEGNVVFFVRDTGIGIPQNRQKAIFERFVQADIADSRVFEGSGLGLSISKSYTEMLGGSIKLESEEGKGTVFFVTIPDENKQAVPGEFKVESNEQEKLPKNKLKILITEDDAVSVQLLKMYVKDIAGEILVAGNGKEAVEITLKNPDIKLILMDIKMPVMDGFEATEKIREFNEDVKIIAQTAFAQPEDNLKAFEVGCDDFITKPINKKTLLQSIQDLFDN